MSFDNFTMEDVRNLCRVNTLTIGYVFPGVRGLEVYAHDDPVKESGQFMLKLHGRDIIAGAYSQDHQAHEVRSMIGRHSTPEREEKLSRMAMRLSEEVPKLERAFESFRELPQDPMAALDALSVKKTVDDILSELHEDNMDIS